MEDHSRKEILDVYFHGQLAGRLYSDNATLSFNYDTKYLDNQDASKLSASLPLGSTVFDHHVTSAFFSALLPEEGVRARLAKCLGISERNTFALLKKIGGECAGAVSVYPQGVSPEADDEPTYRVFENDEADNVLTSLDTRPFLAGEEDIRISGAGAQDKLIIAFVDGKVAVPTGNTPSTHIIKPPIKGLEETVHNEFFCMKLADAVGLKVPKVEIFWLKEKPYYLVERYDRKQDESGIIKRLHQEDFCQAMRISPEIKYQSEGGPTLEQCFALLDERIASGYMSGRNRLSLFHGVVFNFLIGNGDAHGKNFSILYEERETESLSPFYDLMCTVVYSNGYKAKMAMKLGGKYKFKDVAARHWEKLGSALGFRPDFVRRQVLTMNDRIVEAAVVLSDELNKNPETASPIYKKIVSVINSSQPQMRNLRQS